MPKFLITIAREQLYEAEIDAKDLDDANEVAIQLIETKEYRDFLVFHGDAELVSIAPVRAQEKRKAA